MLAALAGVVLTAGVASAEPSGSERTRLLELLVAEIARLEEQLDAAGSDGGAATGAGAAAASRLEAIEARLDAIEGKLDTIVERLEQADATPAAPAADGEPAAAPAPAADEAEKADGSDLESLLRELQ